LAVWGLAALAAWAAPGFGADLPDPARQDLTDGQRLEALLQRVRLEQQSMKTLAGRFRLLQESDLLLEPRESKGEFLFRAPDTVRWDYETPDAMTVLVRKGRMTTWYRDLKRAEVAEIGKAADRLVRVMNAASALDDLLDSFDARVRFGSDTSQPYWVELLPKYKRIAKRMRSVTLWIDRDRFTPVRIRLEGADGEVTDFTFEEIRVNPQIPLESFELKLPPEVAVTTVQLGAAG
jgi:outer membrane lipoprotein-sorting protein